MKKSELRQIIKEEISKVLNESFEDTHYHSKFSPEHFKPGDFFLRTPDENGEFFKHKEKVKISYIDLPKDGRGNTAIIKTDDSKKMKLSTTSLYNIARKK